MTRRGRRQGGRVVMLGSGTAPLRATTARKRLPASIQAAIDAAEAEETRPRVTLRLALPFPPSVNTLYATVMTPKGKLRRATSERGKDYADTVRWAVQHWIVSTGCLPPRPPFRLTVVAYPPRDGQRHDLTNLFKCPEDALMKAIGEDDDDVHEVYASKRGPDRHPRIDLTLEHIDAEAQEPSS